MDNGEETFASPTAAAADFEFATNGGDGTPKLHDAADEIEALRAAKLDLEEKLDAVGHQNRFLSSESRRLEALVSQAREEAASFEQAAATNEGEAATLRAEVERLQGLLDAEKASHEETRRGAGLGDQLQAAYQEKVALEEEIEALKGSATTADKGGKREEGGSAAATAGPRKDEVEVPLALVAASAAGAAATAVIATLLILLKKR